MSILIVDDSEDFRLLVEAILNKAGYESLVFAHSAEEALKLLGVGGGGVHPDRIDLILMDKGLPGTGGIEALKMIKAVPELAEIPVIMVTSDRDEASVEEAFDAGANDFIAKPPRRLELLSRIRSALTLKKEMELRRAHAIELMEANAKLERLARADGLTGVPNRRSLDEYLERTWFASAREGRPVALLMVDIDFFKPFNDTYGHLAGDDCLRAVAKVLSKASRRPADMAARFGGEEFAVVLPETDLAGALVIAEEIRSEVEALELEHASSSVSGHLTVSVGVASMVPGNGHGSGAGNGQYREPGKFAAAKGLIEAADSALYRAKSGGRNRVVASELEV